MEFSYSIKKNAKVKSKYIAPQNAKRQYNKIEQYESILISSTLSNVIIIFEQYLAKVYQGLILINPKKYFQNQKIEIANIFNRSVRDIVIECVNNEVESNMFDSLKTLSLISAIARRAAGSPVSGSTVLGQNVFQGRRKP